MNKETVKRIYHKFYLDRQMTSTIYDISRTIELYHLSQEENLDSIGYRVLERNLEDFRDLRQFKKEFSQTKSLDNQVAKLTSKLNCVPFSVPQKN